MLVGPSGCGKTTALRMVAGLEAISKGTVSIGGRVVNDVPPKERGHRDGVPELRALPPHERVRQHGLRLEAAEGPEGGDRRPACRRRRAILGLDELLKRKPAALSGGQRQRVAMGRAIVRHPQAFLMDEPLSNLDAKLRVQMRSEIARIQHDLGVTTIYVTHDQTEAMTMGDRVAVIRKGELQQVDTPQELYEHPVNLFVAGFIGSPAMNLFDATLVVGTDGVARRVRRLPPPDPGRRARGPPRLRGVRRPDRRARHPARGHGGRLARVRRRRPNAAHLVDRRAARGARLRRRRALHHRRPARR